MAVNTLWLAALTAPGDDSGTNSRIRLQAFSNGVRVVDAPIPDTAQDDFEISNLYQVNVANSGLDPDTGDDVRIDVATDGDDAWLPELVFVWGERPAGDPRGQFVPLALSWKPGTLSTDASEGRRSRTIPAVRAGTAQTTIRDLLLICETADMPDAGTDSTVTLEIDLQGSQPSEGPLVDSPQADLERAAANLYQGTLAEAFTRDRLEGLRLRNTGDDAWLPKRVFVFGTTASVDEPSNVVISLVGLTRWPFGNLSTDPGEGRRSVALPLLPAPGSAPPPPIG
jgi:hypothetical protein